MSPARLVPGRTFSGASECVGDTAMVSSFADKASFYGLLEMSGNLWEWVHSWKLDIFYEEPYLRNPKGLYDGERQIARGGEWKKGAFISS